MTHYVLVTLGKTALLGACAPPKTVPVTVWEVLTYLSLQQRAISRSELADVVFAGVPSRAQTVRNALSFIRQWIGDIIDTDGSMIAVRPEYVIVSDVSVFQQGTQPQASSEELIFALSLYHGHYLEKSHHQWAHDLMQQLHDAYLRGLEHATSGVRRHMNPYMLPYMAQMALEHIDDSAIQMQYLALLAEHQQTRRIDEHLQMLESRAPELRTQLNQGASMLLLHTAAAANRHEQVHNQRVLANKIWLPSRIDYVYRMVAEIIRFARGLPLLCNIVGERQTGKTFLLKFLAHIERSIPCSYVTMQGFNVAYHLRQLFQKTSPFCELATNAVMHLSLSQQELLANLLRGEHEDAEIITYQYYELLMHFMRHISEQRRVILLIDDAESVVLEWLQPLIDTGAIGVICASREPICDAAVVIPPLTPDDVAAIVGVLLSDMDFPEALVNECYHAQLTPVEVMDAVLLRIHQQVLYWDTEALRWMYHVPAYTVRGAAAQSLTDVQREMLQLIAVYRKPIPFAMMPEWRDRQWREELPVLADVGVGLTADGTALTCWSLSVLHDVDRALDDASRTRLGAQLLPITTGLDRIRILCQIGAYEEATRLLALHVDVAWQHGNAMDLRAMHRLYEEIPMLSEQVQFEKELTFVRLMRFGDHLAESVQSIQMLIRAIHPTNPLYFEMLMSAAAVMRWSISVYDALQLYDRIYREAIASQRTDIQLRVFIQEWLFVGVESAHFSELAASISQFRMPIFQPDLYAALQLTIAYAYGNMGETAQVYEYWHRVNVASIPDGHPIALPCRYYEAMLYFLTLQHDRSRVAMEQVYLAYSAINDLPYQSFAGLFLISEYVRHGMYDTYEQLLHHIYQQSSTTILARQRIVASLLFAITAWRRQQWAFASVMANEGYTIAESIGLVTYRTMAAAILLRITNSYGTEQQMTQAYERLIASMASPPDPYRAYWYHDAAWYAYHQQHYDQALAYAHLALANAKRHTFSFELPIVVQASALAVFKRCDVSGYQEQRVQVVDDVVAYLRTLSDPAVRTSLMLSNEYLGELMGVAGSNGDVLVWLPRADAPRGRAPVDIEQVPVIWSGYILMSEQYHITEKIRLLAYETDAQHAVLLTSTLAAVFGVHVRTVLRALRTLEEQGTDVYTYRSWKRKNEN